MIERHVVHFDSAFRTLGVAEARLLRADILNRTVALLLITLLNLEPLRHHDMWIPLQTFLVY